MTGGLFLCILSQLSKYYFAERHSPSYANINTIIFIITLLKAYCELTEETNNVYTIEKITFEIFLHQSHSVFGQRVWGVGRGHSCSFRFSTS